MDVAGRERTRRVVVSWTPVVVAVLLVGLVALTGGFSRAPGTGPRRFEPRQSLGQKPASGSMTPSSRSPATNRRTFSLTR